MAQTTINERGISAGKMATISAGVLGRAVSIDDTIFYMPDVQGAVLVLEEKHSAAQLRNLAELCEVRGGVKTKYKSDGGLQLEFRCCTIVINIQK